MVGHTPGQAREWHRGDNESRRERRRGPCGVRFIAAQLQLLNVRLDGRVIVDSAMAIVRQRGSCGAVVHRNAAPVLSNDESQRVRRCGSCGAACHRNATAVVGRTSERARDRRLCNDDRRECDAVGPVAQRFIGTRVLRRAHMRARERRPRQLAAACVAAGSRGTAVQRNAEFVRRAHITVRLRRWLQHRPWRGMWHRLRGGRCSSMSRWRSISHW